MLQAEQSMPLAGMLTEEACQLHVASFGGGGEGGSLQVANCNVLVIVVL